MYYASLLRILEKRTNFQRFFPFVKEHTVTEAVWKIILSMKEVFDKDPSITEIDWDEFVTWFKLNKIGHLSVEKHKIYQSIFDTVAEEDLSGSVIENIIESFVNKDYATKISDIALGIIGGDDTQTVHDLDPIIKEFKDESSAVLDNSKYIVTSEFSDLLTSVGEEVAEWRSEELNVSAGPIRKEQLIIVGAVPDSGKTTLLSNEGSHILEQLPEEQQLLWFNNEEGGPKVKKRFLQSVIGWTDKEILDDPLGAKSAIEKRIGDISRVVVFNKKLMTVRDIEEQLERHNPGMIIIDQLFKVEGFGNSFSEVQQMSKLFGWARGIAQTYAPVIAAHQADGSAYGVEYLEMSQLYMSRIAIQGEADIIITLGRSLDTSVPRERRFLYIPKNKNEHGGRMVETLRNGRFEIDLDATRGRFTGPYTAARKGK